MVGLFIAAGKSFNSFDCKSNTDDSCITMLGIPPVVNNESYFSAQLESKRPNRQSDNCFIPFCIRYF